MKKLALLFSLVITTALPGASVLAEPAFMRDVNTACNVGLAPDLPTVITVECSVCHDLNDFDAHKPEQELYEHHGACAFCPENPDCAPVRPSRNELLAEAQGITNEYFETLFKLFMKHLSDAGNDFAKVFPDCPEIAPEIASDFSRSNGALVRRVTERARNARNMPDSWEAGQLEKFTSSAKDKKPRTQFEITKPDGTTMLTKEYEAYAIMSGEDDVKYFRYMRSITLPGLDKLPCLKCHGTFEQLPTGVREAIGAEYPYDMALGYKEGDIRGAWTIKIPIVEGEGGED
jgi:hypothetical protein